MSEDISGKSFIAELWCVTKWDMAPVDFVRSKDHHGDGWLIQGEDSDHVLEFRFDFIKATEGRLLYHISATDNTPRYPGAHMATSTNGYLGFYREHSANDHWRLEIVAGESGEGEVDFMLRDHRGFRVATITENRGSFYTGATNHNFQERLNFLNVEKGSIAKFRAANIRYL